MKKILFKITLMVGVMVGISNYMIYIMTGKAPFSISMPSLSEAKESFNAPSLDGIMPHSTEKAYKWKDANGVVHYSSDAPQEGQNVELLNVNPNANLIQGIDIVEQDTPEKNPAPTEPSIAPGTNVYNPETVKKLIDDAKAVQETMNTRYENLEKM